MPLDLPHAGAEQGAANEAVKRHNLGPCQASHHLRLPPGEGVSEASWAAGATPTIGWCGCCPE